MKSVKFCTSLAALVEALRTSSELNRDRIETVLRTAEIDVADLEPFVHFSDEHYTRNLVFGNEHFQILVLCWTSGQLSPVHAHGQSACGVRVISGTATEARYHAITDSNPYETRILTATNVVAGNGDDIHQVTNDSNEPLITLHVYSPPLVIVSAK